MVILDVLCYTVCAAYVIYAITAIIDIPYIYEYICGLCNIHKYVLHVPILLNLSTFFGIMSLVVFPSILPSMNIKYFIAAHIITSLIISPYIRFREYKLIDNGHIRMGEYVGILKVIFAIAACMCFFLDYTIFKCLMQYNIMIYAMIAVPIYMLLYKSIFVNYIYDQIVYVTSIATIFLLTFLAYNVIPPAFLNDSVNIGAYSALQAMFYALLFNVQSFDTFTMITDFNVACINNTYGKLNDNKNNIFAATAFITGALNCVVNGTIVVFGYYLINNMGCNLPTYIFQHFPKLFYVICVLFVLSSVAVIKNFILYCEKYNLNYIQTMFMVCVLIVVNALLYMYLSKYSNALTLSSYMFVQILICFSVIYGSIRSIFSKILRR